MLMKVQAFDPLKDFTPVGGVGSFDRVIATMKGGLEDKKLRPLATTGLKRSPFLSDVPTVDESGIKGYEVKACDPLTPDAQVKRMSTEIEKWRGVIQQAKIPQQWAQR